MNYTKRLLIIVLNIIICISFFKFNTNEVNAAEEYLQNSSTQKNSIYYVSPNSTSMDWAAASDINSPCTPQTAFDNAKAGDTVQFKGGKYKVPARSSGIWLTGYYAPNYSGTERAPIVFMAYPGETPVFDGTSGGVDKDGHGYGHFSSIMSNARSTSDGTSFHEYITFDGFTFQCDGGVNEARIALTGGDNFYKGQRVRGLIVQNCTFNGGTWDNEARVNKSGTGDNHEGIFVSQVTGLVIRNCKIFDYNHANNNQNTSGIKTYHSDHITIENCEIYDCVRGIYSKSNTDDLTVKYNYIYDCHQGFFVGTSGWWNDANDRTKGYHVSENSNNVLHNNLFVNNKRGPVVAFTQDGGDLEGMVLYNNTIYADTGYTASVALGSGERQQFYNNILYGPKIDNDIGLLKWAIGDNNSRDVADGKAEYNFGLDAADHNQFGDIDNFLIRIKKPNESTVNYTSLAAWQASGVLTNGGNPGEGSLASDPGFLNDSGTMSVLNDFRLAQNSPCLGAGRNGVDMGANIDLVGAGKVAVGTDIFTISFNDVPETAWYARAVKFAADRGITSGIGNNKFDPYGQLTRSQVVIMIMRAYNIAPDNNASDNFEDAGNTWYTGYLAAAKRLGISKGVGNNMFGPNNAISRQEMCTILYNTLKLMGTLPNKNVAQSTSMKALDGFTDANQVNNWAREAMAVLIEMGVINGGNGKLVPADFANRAQMVQMLYSLLSK